MNVLVLLTDLFGKVGGIQTFNRSFVKALDQIAQEKGWNITLLVLNDKKGIKFNDSDYNFARTKYIPCSRNKILFVILALCKCFNNSTIIFGHINFISLAFIFKLCFSKLKMLLLIHGIEVSKKLSLFKKLGVRKVDKVLSVSFNTYNQFAAFNKLNNTRFEVLRNTIDPFLWSKVPPKSREELSLPQGKMVLSVSRLDKSDNYKNIDLVIKAMPDILKEIPNTFYVVVGEGTDRSRLEKLAKELDVSEKIIFKGAVTEDELPNYYQLSDIFVLPSTMEGFGIVFLEAMFYEKPCIAVYESAIPEVIEDGKTGILLKSLDKKALSDSIILLLNNEPMSRSMGILGKEKLNKEFSYNLFKQNLERILECLNLSTF